MTHNNQLEVGLGVRMQVKVKWGKYPSHLRRFVTVLVGNLELLNKELSRDTIAEAQTIVNQVLGGEGADIVKGLAEINL